MFTIARFAEMNSAEEITTSRESRKTSSEYRTECRKSSTKTPFTRFRTFSTHGDGEELRKREITENTCFRDCSAVRNAAGQFAAHTLSQKIYNTPFTVVGQKEELALQE